MKKEKDTRCHAPRQDCRAAEERDGELYCTALDDTDYGERICRFYKPKWQYDFELMQIAKGREGYTPIIMDRDRL